MNFSQWTTTEMCAIHGGNEKWYRAFIPHIPYRIVSTTIVCCLLIIQSRHQGARICYTMKLLLLNDTSELSTKRREFHQSRLLL